MGWFSRKKPSSVSAELTERSSSSAGISPAMATIWVALIGAAATTAGTYIQHQAKVAPLEAEVKKLRDAQAASPAPSPELQALKDENKRLAASLAQMKTERDKYEKLADTPADFGPRGVNYRRRSGWIAANFSPDTCRARLRAYTNTLGEISVLTDSTLYYGFEYKRSSYNLVCGPPEGRTTYFVLTPSKDEEETLRVDKVVSAIRAALE